jgi:acyl-CoA synthetase (AMP-forming)/AMP-acid ligase II
VRLMYGNGLRPDVWKAFRDRFGIAAIAELFGSTEGVITLVNVAKGDFLAESIAHHGLILRRKHNNIYAPVAVDHETGEVLRDPESGFVIRNPYPVGGEVIINVPDKTAFTGYYKNQGATEKRFLKDVFEKGDLWYRCGDALKRDEDGKWYFMDRLGDTFRWKSENVSTAEVSEVLGRYPGVIDANVVGVKIPGHEGRAGLAAILLEKDLQSFDFAAFVA